MRDECEHGNLRRQCPWCLMDQEIKDRDRQIEALQRQAADMRREIDRQALRAEEAERRLKQASVPDGWIMVPKEPTDEMKRACDETWGPMTAWKAWQVMKDAAPEPPKEGDS